MGTGHIMRCLALAQAAQAEGFDCHFIVGKAAEPLAEGLLKERGTVHYVADRWPAHVDLETTLEILNRYSCRWLILDGYHFGPDYHRAVRRAGCNLLLIDDLADLPLYHATAVLNQNIHSGQLKYPLDPSMLPLLGTRYALLRREFSGHPQPIRNPPAQAQRVLLVFGGSDPHNVTGIVVQAFTDLIREVLDIRAVIGSLNPHHTVLQEIVRQSHHHIEILTNVQNMAVLMEWADIAVTAGGTICWELAYMGVPGLLIVTADNQAPIAAELHDLGAFISLGRVEELNPAQLVSQFMTLAANVSERQHLIKLQQAIVDGHGSDRVVSLLARELNTPFALSVRKAQPEDAFMIWQWANDPVTRQNSFRQDAISWDSHEIWYSHKVADPQVGIWVLECEGIPVGQIRYDRIDGTAEISITVGSGYRGRGFSTALLRLTRDLAMQCLRVNRLVAYVFPENYASCRAFLSAGYNQLLDQMVSGHQCVVFEKRG
jgi:UDP-2,4-diacetamido-2,4,6-trideoxy-beta-L-altropyranose hydrolase